MSSRRWSQAPVASRCSLRTPTARVSARGASPGPSGRRSRTEGASDPGPKHPTSRPYPWLADLLFTLSGFTDILGNRLDLYDRVWWFDDLIHLAVTLAVTAAFVLLTLDATASLQHGPRPCARLRDERRARLGGVRARLLRDPLGRGTHGVRRQRRRPRHGLDRRRPHCLARPRLVAPPPRRHPGPDHRDRRGGTEDGVNAQRPGPRRWPAGAARQPSPPASPRC